jgi:rhamnosyltransferase
MGQSEEKNTEQSTGQNTEHIIEENSNYTVDVLIPTYHSDEKLECLLDMLYHQTIRPSRVILLHTIDYDGQEQPLLEISGSDITVIPIAKKNFDHGGTRKYGASLSDADIILFMTQDAVPADEYLIEKLLKPYKNSQVAATYARQLVNDKADLLERYTRNFNYSKNSCIKSFKDIETMGIKAFFCSNVCASYKNEVYRKLGGFVDKTIFNEDMIMAFGILKAGYQIAYAADARVVHSHKYTYEQQFTRNFDLGVSHKQYWDAFGCVKSEAEGKKLVKKTFKFLQSRKKYQMIPKLVINSGFKYIGYQMGLHYDKLPKKLVVRCSMNKSYWK